MNPMTADMSFILLVDDEEDIRDVLTLSLSDLGYRVVCAENGREALDRFRQEMPPLVLTDIKMPAMDGIELLKHIKREAPETEVIMITGHGDMELAIESLRYEAADFITKPINVKALEIALKRARDKILMRRKLGEYTESLERLVKEKTELQDHLSALGLMIGSISHGIKGLLTGLDGGMYEVESGFSRADEERVREGWSVVKMMVERIRKMILDILYYAKERDLNWETVDALRLAEEIVSVMEPKIRQQGIDFRREFDPAVKAIEVDPGCVHSALINILENAVDACMRDTDKGDHRIVFSVGQDTDWIRFSVVDNGVGMDPETVEKIFNLFFTCKGRRGTGLGLFISNRIVVQHGGEIQVPSRAGKGSTFTVRLPKIPPESVKSSADRDAA